MPVLRKTVNLTLIGNRLYAQDSVNSAQTLDAGVQGENNAVALAFAIPSDWQGLTVSIVATDEQSVYEEASGTSGTVTLTLPAALLAGTQRLYAHVEGTDGTNTRRTEDCVFRVHPCVAGTIPASEV